MATDEETRHRIYQRFENMLGPADAGLVMDQLWAIERPDVATKQDLKVLGAYLDARLERELRLMTWRLVVAILTLMSLTLAVAKL